MFFTTDRDFVCSIKGKTNLFIKTFANIQFYSIMLAGFYSTFNPFTKIYKTLQRSGIYYLCIEVENEVLNKILVFFYYISPH